MTNLLTTVEAAAYARVTVATIRNWIKNGKFGEAAARQNVTRGNGCGYRIREDDLDRIMGWKH